MPLFSSRLRGVCEDLGTKALIKLLELEKAKKKKKIKNIRKMIHELKVKTVFSITSLKSLIFFPKNMISTLKGKNLHV